MNQTLADALSEATQDEVVLLSDRQVLASTLRSAQTPWRSLADWIRRAYDHEDAVVIRRPEIP